MVVSIRCNLDTACTSPMFADLMLRRWAFRAELDSPPRQILPRSRGFLPGVVGVESLLVEVVVAESGPGSGFGLDFGLGSLEI